MKRRVNDLGRDRVGGLLFRLALPAIVAQLINALYNIVDRMYIGHMAGTGDLALTGLGICFPVLMFVSALAALVGVGGGARAAIRMGEGRLDDANDILGGCTALMLVLAAAVTAVFQIWKEPLLYLFGASEQTIAYAAGYLEVYLWGTVCVLISLGLNSFITTQGFSAFSMVTVILGAAINIALDPIFIFGLDMGVRGAALATVLAQGVSAAWVLLFLVGKRTRLRLQLRRLRLRRSVLAPVVAIGVSPFIMQSTESLVNIALNSSMREYGGDLAVGAVTICSSVMQIVAMPLFGLTQGAQPIVGFNYGAGQMDRVRKTYRLLLTCALIFTCSIWLLVRLFPGAFVALFNDKPELVEITVWALPIYMGGCFAMCVQNSCQQTFVALGQARVSLLLALLRKIVLLIPLVYLLPRLFGHDEVFFVLLAEPIADIAAATCTGLVFARCFPRILARRSARLAERGELPPEV